MYPIVPLSMPQAVPKKSASISWLVPWWMVFIIGIYLLFKLKLVKYS